MHAQALQSSLTLFDPMYYSPPRSSVHGILQARILERVAMPSSRGSSRSRDWTGISYISCIADRFFYPLSHLGSPCLMVNGLNHGTLFLCDTLIRTLELHKGRVQPCCFQWPGDVWLFASLWIAVLQAFLSLTSSQNLPKFMSIASVMPSSHLILWCPLLPLPSTFPSIRITSNELAVLIRWPKSWTWLKQPRLHPCMQAQKWIRSNILNSSNN